MPVSAEQFSKLSDDEQVKELAKLRFSRMSDSEQEQALGQMKQASGPGALRTAVDSFAQGLSFNLSDEAEGLAKGVASKLGGGEFESARQRGTEEARERIGRGREKFPAVATGAQVAGGLASLAVPGAVAGRALGLGKAATVAATAKRASTAKKLGEGVKLSVNEAGKAVVQKSAVRKGAESLAKTSAKGAAAGGTAGVGERGFDKKAFEDALLGGVVGGLGAGVGKGVQALGSGVVGSAVKLATTGKGMMSLMSAAAANKFGKNLIETGMKALPKGQSAGGFRKLVSSLKEGSSAIQPYKDKLFKAAFESGGAGLAAVHTKLIQEDKNYRRKFGGS